MSPFLLSPKDKNRDLTREILARENVRKKPVHNQGRYFPRENETLR